jgi:hypothetical protein
MKLFFLFLRADRYKIIPYIYILPPARDALACTASWDILKACALLICYSRHGTTGGKKHPIYLISFGVITIYNPKNRG